MKKKIPFDIKYKGDIIAGKVSVETGEGRPVRIIDWNVKNSINCPICVIISYKDSETVALYSLAGVFGDDTGGEGETDLYIIVDNNDYDEDKLTPFQREVWLIIDSTQEEEKGLINVCNKLQRLAYEEILLNHVDSKR